VQTCEESDFFRGCKTKGKKEKENQQTGGRRCQRRGEGTPLLGNQVLERHGAKPLFLTEAVAGRNIRQG